MIISNYVLNLKPFFIFKYLIVANFLNFMID